MRGAIHLGQLGSTNIDVHVTFLPVLLWSAWLGAVQYGGLDGAAFGLVAVVLLFGCVLIHEIGHSLYARTCGIEVEYIILLPIGGLTSLDTSAVSPRNEARIALAGPLANLGLAAILGGFVGVAALQNQVRVTSLAVRALQHPSLLGLLTYLTMANLMLALFNLLPAFPLDGGRILRATLALRMPYEAATHRAAIAGRAFGAGLCAIGVTLAAIGMFTYGSVLIIVALALYGGATYEDRVVRRHTALNAWTVEHVLHAAAQTVGPNQPLSLALASLARGQVVPVVVGDGQRIVGLLTVSELRHLDHGASRDLSVAHVMRTRFPSVRSSDPLWVAYEKLTRANLFGIPVVSRNVYCGLVTLADIRQALKSGQPPQLSR